MSDGQEASKAERLEEFVRRFLALPAASNSAEAYQQLFTPSMLSMIQIERLRDNLLSRFPEITAEIDPPADQERGMWNLNIQREGSAPIVVEWRRDRGFGISTIDEDDPAYGLGPDEVRPNTRAAFERIVNLILSGGKTEPPAAVRLRELRRAQGMTQVELADKAGVGQAHISRIEGRGDVLVSTLAKIVAAMGGTLSIRARFPDGTERELSLESAVADAPAPDLSVTA